MGNSFRTKTLASAIGIALVGLAVTPVAFAAPGATAQAAAQSEANTRAEYIITFVEPGLLHYQGGTQGLAATAASANGRSRKLDVHAPAAVAYQDYLDSVRATHVAAIEAAVGRSLDVTHSYSITLHGIASELTASEAARIAGVPGVKDVRLAGYERLTTFRGPKFIGADSIWDGTATPGNFATRGAGVIVGDLDGGTNSAHPSFANDASCGFDETHPKLKAVDCSTSSGGLCTGPNPEANPGFPHGVHTSSTAAGNTIDNTASPAPGLPDGVTMSGVAPCATVYQYKVCATDTCSGASILAGIQNAITDQVDVINFSISGGTSPWNDNDRDFLDMVNADIFVAAAAGNLQSGETDPTGRVNHRGPWVISVAASTQDEVLSPVLQVVGPGTPPPEVAAIPLTPSDTTTSTPPLSGTPIKSYPANLAGCTDGGGIPPGTFTGAIAVLRRGPTNEGGTACSFSEKSINAANAGAIAAVIANNVVGTISATTPGAPIPTYTIDKAPGDALIAFVGANEADATANVIPSAIGNLQGDVLANFSYRGPTPAPLDDLTKPDITAPGVNIYAALDESDGNYGLMSGTSMATPHVTGSGALLRAVHPDWTPPEVKSALMLTASTSGSEEDGTTPWTPDDVGAGRVDLTKAALAGFVMNETFDNFVAANPATGGDPSTLNLPSARNVACTGSCSWTRVLRNTLGAGSSWTISVNAPAGVDVTVEPSTFAFTGGDRVFGDGFDGAPLTPLPEFQTLTITATPTAPLSDIAFAEIVFHEANGLAPDAHMYVAVEGSP
jgi:subtilisin family serine protease